MIEGAPEYASWEIGAYAAGVLVAGGIVSGWVQKKFINPRVKRFEDRLLQRALKRGISIPPGPNFKPLTARDIVAMDRAYGEEPSALTLAAALKEETFEVFAKQRKRAR